MSEIRCVFCGRLIDTDKQALFRLPPDYVRRPDAIYRRYLEIRDITGKDHNLPDVCGIGSPEVAMLTSENGRPTLVTRTGRNTDSMICPTCHNQILRNTDSASVSSAVFFGGRDSGKTSLVLTLANECITRQFSIDDRFRYIFNDKVCDPALITGAAEEVRNGGKPADLRDPTAIYRVTGASQGMKTLCDVMYDTSASDIRDMDSIRFTLPFAADSRYFVYCIPADKLAETVITQDERADMDARTDMYTMLEACRYAQTPPVLTIAVTKLDLAEKAGGAGDDIMRCHADERALKNYIFTAFPSVGELAVMFTDVHACAVSAVDPDIGGKETTLAGKLYLGLFG
ncbi:MAG: hypothetical protein IK990_08670 [Ruminiclostridium sp.]|nr:hypothetical protein [Ruminiclostridium sp.]